MYYRSREGQNTCGREPPEQTVLQNSLGAKHLRSWTIWTTWIIGWNPTRKKDVR